MMPECVQVYWLEQRLVDIPEENTWLSAAERLQLERFRVAKRRSDWRLGRWTAKCAASAYIGWPNAHLDQIEVVPQPCGAPILVFADRRIAPEISISHSWDVCMCLVGPPGAWIGCDIEKVEMRSRTFIETFFSDNETAAISSVWPPAASLLATVIWSAKESYLKATREGLRRDTKDLEINVPLTLCLEASSATGGGWFPLWISDGGTSVEAAWRLAAGFVETAVSSGARDDCCERASFGRRRPHLVRLRDGLSMHM